MVINMSRLETYLLSEALKPSQFRGLVKGWDKSRYKKIFKGKYRIYLELESPKEDLYVNPSIKKELDLKGYDIENYPAGLAKKKGDGKRLIRIARLLKDNPDLLKNFINDPKRSASKRKELMVVVSRHPYDIVGMTTGRGWTSCMALDKDGYRYIRIDIKQGSIIAYLIRKDDKNINNPVGRLMIRPFVNAEDPKDVLLIPEKRIHGTNKKGSYETILKWLNVFQKEKVGLFTIKHGVYSELGKDLEFRGSKGEEIKNVAPWLEVCRIKNFKLNIQNGKLVWLDGTWNYGTWKDGTWKDGTWEGGIWRDGIWENGTWEYGTWKDGTWVNGKIMSKKFGLLIDSSVDPSIFYEYEKESSFKEELQKKVAKRKPRQE